MGNPVKYERLRRLLLDLGFVPTTVPGSHVVFRRPGSKSTLVLPPLARGDGVDAPTLAAVRKSLAENGLMPAAAFASALNGARPAQHATVAEPN